MIDIQKGQQFVLLAQWLSNPWHMALILALAIWTIAWKGTALYKAAKNSQIVWFVVMLLLNTVGILEIVYIFFVSKKKVQQ